MGQENHVRVSHRDKGCPLLLFGSQDFIISTCFLHLFEYWLFYLIAGGLCGLKILPQREKCLINEKTSLESDVF